MQHNWRIICVDTGSTSYASKNSLDTIQTGDSKYISRTVPGTSHERTAQTAARHVRDTNRLDSKQSGSTSGLTQTVPPKNSTAKNNQQQVIAWEDKSGGGNSNSPASSLYASKEPPNAITTTSTGSGGGGSVVLRYGVVVTGGSTEAGEGGGDDDDVPGDQRGSGRVGQGLRHVRVKLTPGKVDTLLSTQVSGGGGGGVNRYRYLASMKTGTNATCKFSI